MPVTEDKAIRVITFSGKREEWSVWEAKFLAKANRKGFKKVLLGKEKAPADSVSVDESTAAGKELQKVREANETAYEELLLSIDGTSKVGRVAFNLVKLSKTKDLIEGDARLAWAKLKNKYATKSAPSLLKLKREFVNSKLTKKMDPDEWITDLEDLQTLMVEQGHIIEEQELIMHILTNLPVEYEIVEAKLEDKLNDDIDPATLDMVRRELCGNKDFHRGICDLSLRSGDFMEVKGNETCDFVIK